jgi:hypothetical protein
MHRKIISVWLIVLLFVIFNTSIGFCDGGPVVLGYPTLDQIKSFQCKIVKLELVYSNGTSVAVLDNIDAIYIDLTTNTVINVFSSLHIPAGTITGITVTYYNIFYMRGYVSYNSQTWRTRSGENAEATPDGDEVGDNAEMTTSGESILKSTTASVNVTVNEGETKTAKFTFPIENVFFLGLVNGEFYNMISSPSDPILTLE